jgi:hypothetical protein
MVLQVPSSILCSSQKEEREQEVHPPFQSTSQKPQHSSSIYILLPITEALGISCSQWPTK